METQSFTTLYFRLHVYIKIKQYNKTYKNKAYRNMGSLWCNSKSKQSTQNHRGVFLQSYLENCYIVDYYVCKK